MTAFKGRSWGIGATPIVLNSEELATIWHFPAITIKAPLVKKSESKRGEPPVGLPITYGEQTLPGAAGIFATDDEDGTLPTSEFGIGVPESDEPLSHTLPHPVSPTIGGGSVGEVGSVPAPTEAQVPQKVKEPSLWSEPAEDFNTPVQVKAPTSEPEEDIGFVPPNLPT